MSKVRSRNAGTKFSYVIASVRQNEMKKLINSFMTEAVII